jgi:radical SAM superfamily enzyme YgiQ (UPF0313 family)
VRVLLIAANTERINLPTLPLGLALVSAATRASGHEVHYLDLMSEEDPSRALGEALEEGRPDVIGISVRNIDNQDMDHPSFLLAAVRPVVAACRAATTAPIVLGGTGFTLFPEATLRYLGADFGVAGEGEEAFPALLGVLSTGGDTTAVPGVHRPGQRPHRPRARLASLEEPPLPESELWQGADLEDPALWVPVQTRRGCPYRCSYCSTPVIEGRLLRARSTRSIIDQLTAMAASGVRRVQFVDNVFNVPKPYALELCRNMSAAGLPLQFQAILYPHDVDEELASALSDAGCAAVSLGFESGSDAILREFGKRFRREDVRRAAQVLSDHGIRRNGFLLLGGPQENRDSIRESLDFIRSLELDMLKITVGIRIYPETPLARIAVERGIIQPTDDLLLPRFYLTPGLESVIQEELADLPRL